MATVHLRAGVAVRLREARLRDHDGLRALFYTLSADTRYRYFGVGAPATEDWALRLAALGMPAPHAYALVAERRGHVLAVARFVGDPSGQYAEIGLVVADAWQGQGLGTQILRHLGAVAAQQTLLGFNARVLGENRRALRLVRRVFATVRVTWAGGDFDVHISFAAPP